MARDTLDIMVLIRDGLSDPELPGSGDSSASLWSDTVLYSYLDEAQREFARETLCLSDATTYVDLVVTADDPWVDINASIVEIRQAYYGTTKRTLNVRTLSDMERGTGTDDYGQSTIGGNWQSATGTPNTIVTDMESGKGRLYPIPTEASTLDLMVYREPLEEIEDKNCDLEISERFRVKLVHKAIALAVSKDDADTSDPQLEAKQLALWNNALIDAKAFIYKKQRRAPVTKYGGI